MSSSIDNHKINLIFTGLIIFVVGIVVVTKTMQGGVTSLFSYVTLIGAVIWIVFGRRAWWVPVPLAAASGGLVWVGFRIYTHELAMAMSAMTLLPTLAISRGMLNQKRPSLGWSPYLLAGYLIVHMATSLLLSHLKHEEGLGNVLRVYINALWPILFVLAFYHFGSTRLLKVAVGLVITALVLRVFIGIYSYMSPGLLYVPLLNVFFVFSELGSRELREAPLRLIILMIGFFSFFRAFGRRLLIFIGFMASAWFMMLGSGRVNSLMLLVPPCLWMIIQRRFIMLTLTIFSVGTFILTLNANPNLIDGLPTSTRRALSILVLGERLDVQAQSRLSNEWHEHLFKLGFKRWTETPMKILFGNRVEPFDESYVSYTADFFLRADIAAATTRYERSLWTVIATTGLIGGILYGLTLYRLIRNPFRELWRTRIADFHHLVYFFAVTNVLIWVVFSPVHGSFPGVELAWAGLACALYEDMRRKQKAADSLAATAPKIPKRPDGRMIQPPLISGMPDARPH